MYYLIRSDHSSPLVKENLKYKTYTLIKDKPVALKGDN